MSTSRSLLQSLLLPLPWLLLSCGDAAPEDAAPPVPETAESDEFAPRLPEPMSVEQPMPTAPLPRPPSTAASPHRAQRPGVLALAL